MNCRLPGIVELMKLINRLPGKTYLWLAVLIFGAASAVTRKITEIGAQHFVDGHNPISLCNVLFVGNLCALLQLLLLYRQEWQQRTWSQLGKREWVNLVIVAMLAGALAPGLIFQSLALTSVTNVVLLGRLEPPLTLALSIWLLRDRVNVWEAVGAIAAFIGVALTLFLQHVREIVMPMGHVPIGLGELLALLGAITSAIATIIGKKSLAQVPLGIYNVVRTGLGTLIFFVFATGIYGRTHFAVAFSPFLWQWMLLYGFIIVVMGQSFWLTGLRSTSVATASIIGSFTPIIGILAAYFILGEVPTRAQYIGGSVILLGLLLSQVRLGRQPMRGVVMDRVDAAQTEQAIEAMMGFKGI
jgi:drug/metabolite transporter (DMT)-like permease